MKVKYDCIECLARQTVTLAKQVTIDEEIQKEIISYGLKTLSENSFKVSPPLITGMVYDHAKKVSGVKDPFLIEKKEHNKIAKDIIDKMQLKNIIETSEDPFDTAVRVSIAGNIIDFSVGYDIDSDLVRNSIDLCLTTSLHGHTSDQLHKEVKDAKKILILSDNAGEIVFDQLFLDQLPLEKCIYAVKGGPIVNDATIEDARSVGLTDKVHVVETGSQIQGTILEDCNDAFIEIFKSADLVISKGQANYETLNHLDKNIYFLLRAKCVCIAEEIGCNHYDFVITKP